MSEDQVKEKPNYKKTLNLPKTSFSMKANLVQNEPQTQKRWAKAGLYEQLREKGKEKKKFVFHDGPPYANGGIHLGHLLNKVMKDFVVRTRTMSGFDVPYVPGWDCHGLPIEHKVMQELGDKARGMDTMKIRYKCKAYAEKFIKMQSEQMQRLLTMADYGNPYLTMNPRFEASVLEVFGALVSNHLVYRDLKPVHWSIANQTALADAELEYEDRKDYSIFTLFDLTEDGKSKLPAALAGDTSLTATDRVSVMIWTTTPWTLPANMAVALAPRAEYGLYEWQRQLPAGVETDETATEKGYVIVACDLEKKVFAELEAEYKCLGNVTGETLAEAGLTYQHPFLNRVSPLVTAEYVTLEDGTGMVHTAPGHGQEDYQTGLKYRLHFVDLDGVQHVKLVTEAEAAAANPADLPRPDVYCPVKADGSFDATAPEWLQAEGVDVWQANKLVMNKLCETKNLYHFNQFLHSYPHDWRSKTPVIFRATEQWFIAVDQKTPEASPCKGQTLREMAMGQTEEDAVNFLPDWGRNRMRGMLESRPDWCISRQRAWGLPIPAFLGENEGEVLLTRASVQAVADQVRKLGSDVWFKSEPADLLAEYDPSSDPDAPQWVKDVCGSCGGVGAANLKKVHDIFDVWFESGSSWNAVIRQRFAPEADLDSPVSKVTKDFSEATSGDVYPTDLYLEGSDQHRGWFQLSLLPALGATGKAPYKTVLTHGFMVDKDGKKISKSNKEQQKHIPSLEEIFKEYGADICRWWVSSLNTDNDIKVDKRYLAHAGEEYRKIRNTLRFLLSNLGDFDASSDKVRFENEDATSLDAWVTGELIKLSDTVRGCYDNYEFRRAHVALFDFCNETLSSVYLAAVKDRLYCDKVDSRRRRRTQTAIHRVTGTLIRLLAPIMPHTAEEAWAAFMQDKEAQVHLLAFQDVDCMRQIPVSSDWEAVMARRHDWQKAVEEYRQAEGIKEAMDLGLAVDIPAGFEPVEIADLCGVSQAQSSAETKVLDLQETPRCDRSWKRDGTVKQRSDGGMLSDRDAEAMGV